jgi:putative ABC transport system permease protein
MLLNYLTIALRNLRKNKIFSFINITGLSVGIACVLFIALFIQNELNYDRFHVRGEQIYRVLRLSEMNGKRMGIPYTSAPYATGLTNDFPADIIHAVRVMPSDGLVTVGEKSFIEKRFFFADSTFFKIFSFPLQQGNPVTVLDKTNSIVLSAAMATKYFGQTNPIGKTIMFEKEMPFEVTGIMADLPGNSHLEFDCIASLAVFRNAEWFDGWWNNNLLTYVLLPEQVQVPKLEAKLRGFMDKYFGQDFKRIGQRTDLQLQPLSEIYFGSHTDFDPSAHGDSKILYLFAAIAVFILSIACINFMNLSTARSAGRAREVGMRKVMGAYKSSLVTQFLGESVILTLIAVLLALVLVAIDLPQFSAFIGKTRAIHFANPCFVLFLFLLTGIVGVGEGNYQACFLSSFRPVKVLKGKFIVGNQAITLRKALVVT